MQLMTSQVGVYMHVCMCLHMYAHAYGYMGCVHAHMRACMYAYVCMQCVRTHGDAYICMCMVACACMHSYTCEVASSKSITHGSSRDMHICMGTWHAHDMVDYIMFTMYTMYTCDYTGHWFILDALFRLT